MRAPAMPCTRHSMPARSRAVSPRLGLDTIEVASDATDRALYLRRPDYGRRLSPASRDALQAAAARRVDLALVIGDGLSATAVHAHAVPLIAAFLPHCDALELVAGACRASHAARASRSATRSARCCRRALVAVLIGERPGLSSPDSLGVYLTFGPRPGRSDAERNCISNIRAEGLSYELAAFKLAWLVREALRRR